MLAENMKEANFEEERHARAQNDRVSQFFIGDCQITEKNHTKNTEQHQMPRQYKKMMVASNSI